MAFDSANKGKKEVAIPAKVRDVEQFLTCKVRLHNPSQRKRAMLDKTMRRSHLAFDKLLRTVKDDVLALDAIEDKEARKAARAAITKRMQDIVRPLPLGSGPKQAVIMDADAQIDSFLALKSEDKGGVVTGYPAPARLDVSASDVEAARGAALDKLANALTVEEENEARDELARVRAAGKVRPLSIYKNRIHDGSLILSDEKGRLSLFVNLISATDAMAQPVNLNGLIDTRTGEVIERGPVKTGALFPLACGDWHEKKFLAGGTLQSGRIIKDGDDYIYAASFKFTSPARPEPVNYLGVDRGIAALAAWTVVDRSLNIIADGFYSGERLRHVQRREERAQAETQRRGKRYKDKTRRAVADEEVHKAANAIVAAAVEHNARVVMEDLSAISNGPHQKRAKGARKGGFRRMVPRAQYQKLQEIVNYKLAMEGFPPVRRGGLTYYEIHAAYTSTTCSKCGHKDKASRLSQAEFCCTSCGHEANADVNAAANIASKGAHFDAIVRGRKKGDNLKEHEKWPQWLLSRKTGAGSCK